jgi:anthranilate synthase component 1
MLSGHSVVPVYCRVLSDQLTPVSAFARLSEPDQKAFLLESVIGGEKIARYSFIGIKPFASVQARDSQTTVTTPSGDETIDGADPLVVLEGLIKKHRAPHLAGLPRFLGGAVGFASYDLARHYEDLPDPPDDDRRIDDLDFGIYDEMVIFDHVCKVVNVVVHARLDGTESADAAYDDACSRIQRIIDKLADLPPDPIRPFSAPEQVESLPESNVDPARFEQAVDHCKEYIRAGDIFQVVISQRFSAETDVPPFDVYRALRAINPSPFMFYLQSPQVTLVGASPEILCRLEGETLSTRPLAGTRPRGNNEAEDLGLETELLADPKERAEHVMLVDLGRNDLGRVCEAGTIKIDDLMSVERFSHVMHICSNVSGTLAPGMSAFDALRSVLPVGTVSGAPKIRAMEIIDELETARRGPYAGAVGYIDFAGNMDTCIALRTMVITPGTQKRFRVDVPVGAGIVADSEPAREYQETVNKAKAMLSALTLASSWH